MISLAALSCILFVLVFCLFLYFECWKHNQFAWWPVHADCVRGTKTQICFSKNQF